MVRIYEGGISMKVTIFPSIKNTTSGHVISIDQVFNRIRNNSKNKDKIAAIRSLPTKKERDELKVTLPLYCFSGIFSKRNEKSIQEHSGLICLDFDKETRDNIMAKKEYIFACFLSPSGTGYKVLVKIPPSIEDHEDYFNSLQDYFGLSTFDSKVKNIATGCFDTEDPDMYVNVDAPVYLDKLPKEQVDQKQTKHTEALRMDDHYKIMDILKKSLNKRVTFTSGQRNDYIYQLSCAYNRYGVPLTIAIGDMRQYAESDFPEYEIQKCVEHTYHNNKHENGTKFFIDNQPVHFVNELKRQGKEEHEIYEAVASKWNFTSSRISEIIEQANNSSLKDAFWYIKKTKDDRTIVDIDNERLKLWYSRHGIYRYAMDNEAWMMVKEVNAQVKEINIDSIRSEITGYFENLPEKIEDVNKSFILKSVQDKLDENYLKRDKLAWIPYHDLEWQQDTRDTAYFYYRNAAVKVTAESFEVISYSDLAGSIWKEQIIDRDFKLLGEDETVDNSEFSRFIFILSTGRDYVLENDLEPYQNLMKTIGYVLHSYKDPSNPKAVILTDEVISDNPEGGIGKGIFIKGIGKIKKSVVYDGKNWNWNRTFLFQRVNLSTQVMAFEDVSKQFDFERMFSIITEGIEVEKKNKDTFYIQYANSPKVVITSNYAIQGTGGSHDRRRHEVELKKFFGTNYTPRDYFGHNLYDDWDQEQWYLFDNFMMICVQDYLKHGLGQPNQVNMAKKRLLNVVNEEIVSYFETIIKPDAVLILNHVSNAIRTKFHDYEKVNNRTVSRWIDMYCNYQHFKMTKKHIDGGTELKIEAKN